MRSFLAGAIKQIVRRCTGRNSAGGDEPPWMAGFGALSDISDENRRVLDIIETEFESLPPKDAA